MTDQELVKKIISVHQRCWNRVNQHHSASRVAIAQHDKWKNDCLADAAREIFRLLAEAHPYQVEEGLIF